MGLNRRQFIKRALLTLASVEVLWLVKEGVSKNANLANEQKWFKIGRVDDFQKGQTYSFLQQKFYLKRFNDGGFLAISLKCTHLGCLVNFNNESQGFVCPCHSSHFNEQGEVMSAPAPRPLDTFPVYIQKGELFADVSHPQKRTQYQKSQLTYA